MGCIEDLVKRKERIVNYMNEEILEFKSKLNKNDCKVIYKKYTNFIYFMYLVDLLIIYYFVKIVCLLINNKVPANQDVYVFFGYIFIWVVATRMLRFEKKIKVIGTKIYVNEKSRNYSKVLISGDFLFLVNGRRRGVIKIPNGKKDEIIDYFEKHEVVYEILRKPCKVIKRDFK